MEGETFVVGSRATEFVQLFNQLRQKALFNPSLPWSEWPTWARTLAGEKVLGDRGVGDTVERTVGLMGSPAFLSWYHATIGGNAPCPDCPAVWNRLYPYEQAEVTDGMRSALFSQEAAKAN